MGMPRIGAKRWTAAMVRAFPEDGKRYEVIEGELLVTPAPRAVHQRAVREMAFALHEWVKGQDIGEVLMSPADIELEPRGLVQPDIFVAPVVRKWADVRSLALAVEVLSPSTEQYDREKKRRLFSRVGVPEYWIVDCDRRCVERWRPGDKTPETLTTTLAWHPHSAAVAFVLDLVAYFKAVHVEGK